MKMLFAITHVMLAPLMLIARWNCEHFVFVFLLLSWFITGIAYITLFERD